MSEAKPVNTCLVSKDSMVSLDHEDTYLEYVIKTEEVDLEPDYIKCEIDEETDNSDGLVDSTNDNSIQMTDDTYNKDIEERSGLNMDFHTNMETSKISPHYNDESHVYIEISGVKLEVEKNDELSANEIPEDLNTEINVKQIQESDSDISVGEEVCYSDNISVNLKSDILKPKNAQNEKILQICDICNKSYTSARNLRRHAIIKHSFTKKNCIKKKFKIHTEEKTFSCQFCEYRCATNRDLTTHLRTHTGEKPFSCDMCSYKTVKKSHLTRHMATHTGLKQFSCDVCGYKSALKHNLRIHLRTHTSEKPFSCDICCFKFSYRQHLTRHMRTHTGERPFSCDICTYKCAQKGSLKTHMRTHTGTKPFSCAMCSYKSAQKGSLTTHMRTHTATKPFS